MPRSVPPAADPTSTTYSVAPADAPQEMAAVRSFMTKAPTTRPVGAAGCAAAAGGVVGEVGVPPLLLHAATKVTAATQSTSRLTTSAADGGIDAPVASVAERNCDI